MKVCPKCNEKFEAGKFCKFCGSPLQEEAQEMHCTSCGAKLDAGAKFCVSCGAKVDGGAAAHGESRISSRDLRLIQGRNFERYDLESLAWARLETDDDDLEEDLDNYIMQTFGIEGVLKEEARTQSDILQRYLCACYLFGIGVARDESKGVGWLQKSAENGNYSAMVALGNRYSFGDAVQQDYGKAAYWYQKAVDKGNSTAMLRLGDLYAEGEGVLQDYDKAIALYEEAAEIGNDSAMTKLGDCYRYGRA